MPLPDVFPFQPESERHFAWNAASFPSVARRFSLVRSFLFSLRLVYRDQDSTEGFVWNSAPYAKRGCCDVSSVIVLFFLYLKRSGIAHRCLHQRHLRCQPLHLDGRSGVSCRFSLSLSLSFSLSLLSHYLRQCNVLFGKFLFCILFDHWVCSLHRRRPGVRFEPWAVRRARRDSVVWQRLESCCDNERLFGKRPAISQPSMPGRC